MASGDHCLFRKEGHELYYVIHFDCDDFPDGTVTDLMTGEIVK